MGRKNKQNILKIIQSVTKKSISMPLVLRPLIQILDFQLIDLAVKDFISITPQIFTYELWFVKNNHLIQIKEDFILSEQQIILEYGGVFPILLIGEQPSKAIKNQLQSLSNRVINLQKKIDLIEMRQQTSFQLSLTHRKSKTINNTRLDIGIMYSDPLVRKASIIQQPKSMTQPVNYYQQIRRLRNSFQKHNLSMECMIASNKRLAQMFKRRPKILHIICHGIQKSNKQYSLCFQSHQNVGKLYQIQSNWMQSYLQQFDTNQIELLFLNACHSQEIAQRFLNATKIKYAVCVQSTQTIQDAAAMVFSQNFYYFILFGYGVTKSFQMARNHTRSQCNFSVCCCAHTHLPNCNFKKQQEQLGMRTAHSLYHVPGLDCRCQKRNQNTHTSSCNWAIQTLKKINKIYVQTEKIEFMQFSNLHICCCSSIPRYKTHDQSMKFRLLTKSGQDPNLKVLDVINSQNGFRDDTAKYLIQPIYSGTILIGRNSLIFRIISSIVGKVKTRDCRTVIINGSPGSGKTSLAKKCASYLIQRGYFKDDYFFINLTDVLTITSFRYKFANRFQNFNVEQAMLYFSKKYMIFVLDNADQLLQSQPQQFIAQLKNIINKVAFSRIIIVIDSKFANRLKSKFISLDLDQVYIQIPQLNSLDVAKIFLEGAGQIIRSPLNNPKVLRNHQVFKLIQTTPRSILQVSNSFKIMYYSSQKKITLDEFVCQLKSKHLQNAKGLQTQQILIQSIFTRIKQQNPNAFQLLLLISVFSGGVSLIDLQVMGCKQILLVNSQWRSNLFFLLNINNQSKNINIQQLIDGQFYLLQILTKQTGDKLSQKYIRTKQMIKDILFKIYPQQIQNKSINGIRYMTHFIVLLINSVRQKKIYHQKLIQLSAISQSGFWGIIPCQNYQKYFGQQEFFVLSRSVDQMNQKITSFSQSFRINMRQQANLKKCIRQIKDLCMISPLNSFFNHHQSYLRILQNYKNLESIMNNPKRIQRILRYCLFILVTTVPSFYAMINKYSMAGPLVQQCLDILNRIQKQNLGSLQLNQKSPMVSITKVKLMLFDINLYFKDLKRRSKLDMSKQQYFRQHNKLIQKIQNFMMQAKQILSAFKQDDLIIKILNLDYYFIKSLVWIKIIKFDKDKKSTALPIINQSLQNAFQIFQSIKKTVIPNNLSIIWSKLIFTKAKLIKLEFINQNFIKNQSIYQAIQIFKKNGMIQLAVKSMMILLKFKVQLLQKSDLKHQLNQYSILRNKQVSQITSILQNKSYRLSKRYQSQMKDTLDHIDRQLEKINNGFVVLQRFQKKKISIPQQFTYLLFQKLKALGKQTYYKFDNLSQKNIKQTLSQNHSALVINLTDIQQKIFQNLQQNYFFNFSFSKIMVLIICRYSNSFEIRQQIMASKNLIIFEMSNSINLVNSVIQHRSLNIFISCLFINLIKGMQIEMAFNKAQNQTVINCITQQPQLVDSVYKFQSTIGKPKLIKHKQGFKLQLKVGHTHNLSRKWPINNLQQNKKIQALFPDKMVQISNYILKHKGKSNIINYFGKSGIGKSSILKQTLRYFILTKQQFSSVYLLKGKKIIQEAHGYMKQYIQKCLGIQFWNIQKAQSQRLIVIDDFHYLKANSQKQIFYNYIITTLIYAGFTIILVTKQPLLSKNILTNSSEQLLDVNIYIQQLLEHSNQRLGQIYEAMLSNYRLSRFNFQNMLSQKNRIILTSKKKLSKMQRLIQLNLKHSQDSSFSKDKKFKQNEQDSQDIYEYL